MKNTTVVVGADHAGFYLKESLKKYLMKRGHRVVDKGAYRHDKNDDYPDAAFKVAERSAKHGEKGVLVCGSAAGVCIAANKVRGARAVTASTKNTAKMARQHNDVNVLCLSGWDLSLEKAKGIVDTFLTTPFSAEERHVRRLKKIRDYES